jgi:hypothetical protein
MNHLLGNLTGCPCRAVNRRNFLASGCAACASAVGLTATGNLLGASSAEDKVRVRIIFALHAAKTPSPDWPHVGFDFQPVMDRIQAALRKGCPDFEFLTSLANGPEATKKILEGDKSANIDGYLVYQMNAWNQVVQNVVASGKPTLYADFPYGGSGGFLVYTAAFLRNKAPNFGFVSTGRLNDVVAAVKCFALVKKGGAVGDFVAATAQLRLDRTPAVGAGSCTPDSSLATLSPKECLQKMKEAKILAVGGGWPGIAPAIKAEMGIEVSNVSFAELKEAAQAADKEEACAFAERWQKTAAKIEGVSPETLEKSAGMALGMKALLKKHRANAITINCLGGFYGGHLQAYPCLGHYELFNEGLIGACECDLRSTATMVAVTALTQGRPGFISDPVIDTASRQIIYAHCVASNRVFGPKGKTNPFQILTHSEDRKGASVRSLMPLGYMTTTVEFAPERKVILFHQGKAVGNVIDDRACRTKLAVDPAGDMEKLFREWDQWGWHRVTFYGDLKEPIFALADALKWKVFEEA